MKVALIPTILLFSCGLQEQSENQDSQITEQLDETESIDQYDDLHNDRPTNFDKQILVYEMTKNGEDSILNCETLFLNDKRVYKDGSCYYHSPFQSDYISENVFEQGKHERYIETFDPLMCEVGGNSAYDKYEFEKSGEAISKITHYKAWYEGYTDDGEPITYDTPNWFIGEIIEVSYVGNSRTLSTYDSENKLIDILTNTYNQNGDLVYQEWIRPEDKTFHSFYNF